VGSYAGNFIFNGNNNIEIGNAGVNDESDTVRIGTKGTRPAPLSPASTTLPSSGRQSL